MDAQCGEEKEKYDHGNGFSSILRELSDRQRAFLDAEIKCHLCNSILQLHSNVCAGDLHLREQLTCENCQILWKCRIHLIQ